MARPQTNDSTGRNPLKITTASGKFPTESAGNPLAANAAMREKFYGLLREYLLALRERDLAEDRVRDFPEGRDREDAARNLQMIRKRCLALRREIRRYPDINSLSRASSEKPPLPYASS